MILKHQLGIILHVNMLKFHSIRTVTYIAIATNTKLKGQQLRTCTAIANQIHKLKGLYM